MICMKPRITGSADETQDAINKRPWPQSTSTRA